jgi:hypothetical protein
MQADKHTRDLLKYLDKLVDKRATDLKDDLISTLISEQARTTLALILKHPSSFLTQHRS